MDVKGFSKNIFYRFYMAVTALLVLLALAAWKRKQSRRFEIARR